MTKRFCESQIQCKEDILKESYTCIARLAEARALQCPYEESDITLMDEYGNGRPQIRIQKNPRSGVDGICRYFEIISGIKDKILLDLEKKFVESQ